PGKRKDGQLDCLDPGPALTAVPGDGPLDQPERLSVHGRSLLAWARAERLSSRITRGRRRRCLVPRRSDAFADSGILGPGPRPRGALPGERVPDSGAPRPLRRRARAGPDRPLALRGARSGGVAGRPPAGGGALSPRFAARP